MSTGLKSPAIREKAAFLQTHSVRHKIKYNAVMTQNTIDLAGAMVALAILVAMFTFATLYELKHGKDDDEDSQR